MDDYFIRIFRLASGLSSTIINFIEDLLFGHHERSSNYTEFSSSEGEYSDASTHLVNEDLCRNESFEAIDTIETRNLFLQWLLLPLYGIKMGCKFASTCFQCCCTYVENIKAKTSGFFCRVKKTLHGSEDDIGWLQRTEGFPCVDDGTARFMEVLDDIRNGKHSLPNTMVYLLIPGLFSNLSPLYFVNTKRFFSKMGLTSHVAKIHSEASVEKNAWELKQYIDELYWGSGKKVLLLGHSKGGVDAAAALSLYWPELKDKVAGLALVQSPYGGTPIASDILREGQIADKEARKIMEFIICKVIKGDMRALDDLTYDKRKDFITKHKLPSDQIPIISFHSEASIAPGVLYTLSLVAHAELPWIPVPNFLLESEDIKVPIVIPVAAAMAITALHLKLRYGESSDGLVTRRDAEVPGSVVVRPDRKLDHAWMVYSSLRKDDVEADSSEMCEALLTMLVELGIKQKND